MGIEIERKFLLADDGWRDQVHRSDRIAQGYLVGAAAIVQGHARASVRIRVSGQDAWLNIKSATLGIARQEYEYPVPLDDAERLLADLSDGVLEKIRHYVTIDGALFEIDEFLGANEGLLVAEVELPSVDAPYPQPAWLGTEVSHEARYYNVNLIARPFEQWSVAEREGKGSAPC